MGTEVDCLAMETFQPEKTSRAVPGLLVSLCGTDWCRKSPNHQHINFVVIDEDRDGRIFQIAEQFWWLVSYPRRDREVFTRGRMRREDRRDGDSR